MRARADGDAARSARFDIDVMRAAARLRDVPQTRKLREQSGGDRRALANENERFGLADFARECRGIERWALQHAHVMAAQFFKAVERCNELLVIVGYRDKHGGHDNARRGRLTSGCGWRYDVRPIAVPEELA